MKWQYLTLRTYIQEGLVSDVTLNELGAHGWELVSIASHKTGGIDFAYLFKRPWKPRRTRNKKK
jgi:hypothetical protein